MEISELEDRIKRVFASELPLPPSLEPERLMHAVSARCERRRTRRFAARAAALAASAALCAVVGLCAADGVLGMRGEAAVAGDNNAMPSDGMAGGGYYSYHAAETSSEPDSGKETSQDTPEEEGFDDAEREPAYTLSDAQDSTDGFAPETAPNDDGVFAPAKSDSDLLRAARIANARAKRMLSVD